MQRNMDLIRLILLKIEEAPKPQLREIPVIEGFSQEEIVFHLILLDEIDFVKIDATEMANGTVRVTSIHRMTWQGYDFLEKVKNETVWQKTKAKFKDKLSAMPFSLLNDVALELCKKAIDTA